MQSHDSHTATPPPTGLLPVKAPLPKWLSRLAIRMLAMDRIQTVIDSLEPHCHAGEYAQRAIKHLGVRFAMSLEDLERIPASGGVIGVANHPYGGLDGLIGIAALQARRPDLKLLANGVLTRLGPLAGHIIPVDPHGHAVHSNARAMRAAVRHAASGSALLIFPSG